MHIRQSTIRDIEEIMRIYDAARKTMRTSGNHSQWINGYPKREMVEDDIARRVSYVIEGDDGRSNVRSGPGLKYKSLGVLHVGEDARFLGKTSTDDRGIPWYKIKWNGGEGWVSSRYTCKVKY